MTKLVVILGFLLAFAAGLVVGSRTHVVDSALSSATHGSGGKSTTKPSAGGRRGSAGWLQTELGLSNEQRAKLDQIWTPLAAKGRTEREERRREYRRERDQAIADLVPASQLGEYDHIIDTYNERTAGLDRESRDAYEAAVEQTKQILTPEQRTRYEELLKRFHWGPPQLRERHPSSRRSETRPGVELGSSNSSDSASSVSSSSTSAPSRAGDTKGAQ